MNITEKQILDIKKIYPNNIGIYEPFNKGFVHNIYIVKDKDNNEFVCRFSSENIAKHNSYVSKLLNSNGIKVPDVSLYNFGEEYCETYPFIKGKLLYERIQEGISKDKMENVYKQLFDISYKMAQIPYNFDKKIEIPLTAKVAIIFSKILNSTTNALCHTDLNFKNIVLDNDDNVCALLDLDGVLSESMAFVFINTLRTPYYYGYGIETLTPLCRPEYIKPRLFGIKTQTKLYSAVRVCAKKILGKAVIKQLLKIKVK